MTDKEFLKAMHIQTGDEACPPSDEGHVTAAIGVQCSAGMVHMTGADFCCLIEANRTLYAEWQAAAREAAAAKAAVTAAGSNVRTWRGAYLVLACGVAVVTVWGLVR
jgi:hypothetical protein